MRPRHPGDVASRAFAHFGDIRGGDGMSDLLQFGLAQTRAAALAGVPAERLDALAATIELAPLGITHFDRDGNFLLANRCFCQMLGYPRDEVLRRSFLEITFAED